jgi:hypothetical protein
MIAVFELASSQALGNVNQLLDHDHQELLRPISLFLSTRINLLSCARIPTVS